MIEGLRETARRLRSVSSDYEWGHMGRCNAGQLVQTMMGITGFEIVRTAGFAMEEWSEHANDYCSGTGGRMDAIFDTMRSYGLDHEAIVKLEQLSDSEVLENLSGGFRHLRRNNRHDVAEYMSSLAELISRKNAA